MIERNINLNINVYVTFVVTFPAVRGRRKGLSPGQYMSLDIVFSSSMPSWEGYLYVFFVAICFGIAGLLTYFHKHGVITSYSPRDTPEKNSVKSPRHGSVQSDKKRLVLLWPFWWYALRLHSMY